MSIIERAAQRLADRRRKSMEHESGQTAQMLEKFPGSDKSRQPASPFDDMDADGVPQPKMGKALPPMPQHAAVEVIPNPEPDSILADDPDTREVPFITRNKAVEYEESPFSTPFTDHEITAKTQQPDRGTPVDGLSTGGGFTNRQPSPDRNGPANADADMPWPDRKTAGDVPGEDEPVFPDLHEDGDNTIRLTEIDQNLLLSPNADKTRTAEEFRIIKRPLLVKAFDRTNPRNRYSNLIMITSSLQSEGKTFISANLAISIAMEMDSTVLLVDADVAKPGLSKMLQISNRPGLIETLTDEHGDLSQLLLPTDIPTLTVLPAGRRHRRSTELLSSIKMRDLLDEMGSRYSDRIVLFDSPPLLESTEAFVLASQMGQVVLVVESDVTSQMMVKESLSQFDNTENVSIILNKCKDNVFTNLMSGKYAGYGYGYGYGDEPDKK